MAVEGPLLVLVVGISANPWIKQECSLVKELGMATLRSSLYILENFILLPCRGDSGTKIFTVATTPSPEGWAPHHNPIYNVFCPSYKDLLHSPAFHPYNATSCPIPLISEEVSMLQETQLQFLLPSDCIKDPSLGGGNRKKPWDRGSWYIYPVVFQTQLAAGFLSFLVIEMKNSDTREN